MAAKTKAKTNLPGTSANGNAQVIELKKALSNLPKNVDTLTKDELAKKYKDLTKSISKLPLGPLKAPSTDLVSELNNIDFDKMIGGPLQAVIKAQADAAMTTVNFIKEVGFVTDSSGNVTDVRKVQFKYEKTKSDGTTELTNIEVPFLAMLQVPCIRIDTAEITFNAKLNSVESQNVSSKLTVGTELGVNVSVVNFKASMSYQRTSSYGVEVKKEYSLNIHVKATQDEMPAGLEKILNLMAA